MSCFIRFGNVGGSGGNIWIFGRTLPGGWRSFCVWEGQKSGRQRERISARARTPSGDTTKVP